LSPIIETTFRRIFCPRVNTSAGLRPAFRRLRRLANQSEATCLSEMGFDPNKAPKNLFANEPLLSTQLGDIYRDLQCKSQFWCCDAPPEKVVKSSALTAPVLRSRPPVMWASVRPSFLSASKEMPSAFASLIGSAAGTLAIKCPVDSNQNAKMACLSRSTTME
jgi:hypothetical protein